MCSKDLYTVDEAQKLLIHLWGGEIVEIFYSYSSEHYQDDTDYSSLDQNSHQRKLNCNCGRKVSECAGPACPNY